MSYISEYYEFIEEVKNKALNRERMYISLEFNGCSCSIEHAVDQVREDDDHLEIIAGAFSIVFEKNDNFSVGRCEEFGGYIISDGKYNCLIM